jgi:hypothetical protein
MLFRERVTVCCENHTEHITTLFRLSEEFYHVKASGTRSYHWVFKGKFPPESEGLLKNNNDKHNCCLIFIFKFVPKHFSLGWAGLGWAGGASRTV